MRTDFKCLCEYCLHSDDIRPLRLTCYNPICNNKYVQCFNCFKVTSLGDCDNCNSYTDVCENTTIRMIRFNRDDYKIDMWYYENTKKIIINKFINLKKVLEYEYDSNLICPSKEDLISFYDKVAKLDILQ